MTRRTRTFLSLLGLAVALGAGTQLSRAGEGDAAACLDQLVANAAEGGYRLRMSDSDKLAKGGELGYTTVLTGGSEYIIFACGDSAVTDLDIYLYDESGKLVDRDGMVDGQPIVAVTPDHTGSYHILVKSYAAEGEAYFKLAVMYN